MIEIVFLILGFCFFLELIFNYIIKFLRLKKIPWIITNQDEYPKFEREKIKIFLNKSFHKYLGWNWKPKIKHQEIISSKINKIHFGIFGERLEKKIKKNIFYDFASFGDSFVFCRYVKNHETWQSYLAKKNSFKGLNLGVGNYGLDQIYLKYKITKIPKRIKKIYIGFVPETLSRCLCSWKHYHEFNNIYGFKPKFIKHKGKLKFIKNPIDKDLNSFVQIKKIIKELKKREFFYLEKFKRFKLGFPYFFTILKNPSYNFKLFFFSILKITKINENKIHDFIIKENCIKNDFYFKKKKYYQIIESLMNKIKNLSKKRGHEVTFLIFPQKYDLDFEEKNYYKFFSSLKKSFDIIDFTEIFMNSNKNLDKIYLPSKYGAHLTKYGNQIVAETIIAKRRNN